MRLEEYAKVFESARSAFQNAGWSEIAGTTWQKDGVTITLTNGRGPREGYTCEAVGTGPALVEALDIVRPLLQAA